MNRREWRRRRRRRNQIITYIVFLIILAAVVGGVFFGIRHISNAMMNGNSGQEGTDATGEGTESMEESAPAEGSGTEESVQNAGETGETQAVPETAQAETAVSEEALLEEAVDNYVAGMSLEDKVAGLFIVTPEQLTGVGTAVQAGEGTKEALAKYPVGGLVYFSQNIQSAEQIKEMLANTRSYSKYPLFLAVDEEGGQVSRVAKQLGLEDVGAMADIGAGQDASAAYEVGTTIGSYLKEYGFNLDFAPIADVLTNPDNTVIGDRSFGSDPQLVSQMVASEVQGLQESGVSACLKHFPGHGNTSGDSHNGAVETDRTLEEMQAAEFLPFSAGMEAGVDMIMAGHISAPGLTDGDSIPASMNEKIITDILRKQLGYDGIVITDAMNMGAISEYYAADEAAIKALKAGVDMILMPEEFVTAYEGVIAAVQDGTIDERRIDDSLKRIYLVKYADTLAEQ